MFIIGEIAMKGLKKYLAWEKWKKEKKKCAQR
jgi:hypothetical protein